MSSEHDGIFLKLEGFCLRYQSVMLGLSLCWLIPPQSMFTGIEANFMCLVGPELKNTTEYHLHIGT